MKVSINDIDYECYMVAKGNPLATQDTSAKQPCIHELKVLFSMDDITAAKYVTEVAAKEHTADIVHVMRVLGYVPIETEKKLFEVSATLEDQYKEFEELDEAARNNVAYSSREIVRLTEELEQYKLAVSGAMHLLQGRKKEQ